MRVQLALNVSNLDAAVEFYGTLFDAVPHKRRPGYANFAIEQPPLKLVLFEQPDAGGTLNHLGVEADEGKAVVEAANRLTDAGFRADVSEEELCCHAVQDKVWTDGPDAERWEVYVVTDDNPSGGTEAPRATVEALPGTDQSRTVCCT